jgi:hypothetical protein
MGLLHFCPAATCTALLAVDAQQKQHLAAAVAGVPGLLLLTCQSVSQMA